MADNNQYSRGVFSEWHKSILGENMPVYRHLISKLEALPIYSFCITEIDLNDLFEVSGAFGVELQEKREYYKKLGEFHRAKSEVFREIIKKIEVTLKPQNTSMQLLLELDKRGLADQESISDALR